MVNVVTAPQCPAWKLGLVSSFPHMWHECEVTLTR